MSCALSLTCIQCDFMTWIYISQSNDFSFCDQDLHIIVHWLSFFTWIFNYLLFWQTLADVTLPSVEFLLFFFCCFFSFSSKRHLFCMQIAYVLLGLQYHPCRLVCKTGPWMVTVALLVEPIQRSQVRIPARPHITLLEIDHEVISTVILNPL